MEKKEIGRVMHYFDKAKVSVIELTSKLKKGDTILIEGKGHIFEQKVESMQINKKDIEEAKSGDAIGMQVIEPAKEGYMVYKIIE